MSAIRYKAPTYELSVRKIGPHDGATGPIEIWTVINPLKETLRQYFFSIVLADEKHYRLIRYRRIATRWE